MKRIFSSTDMLTSDSLDNLDMWSFKFYGQCSTSKRDFELIIFLNFVGQKKVLPLVFFISHFTKFDNNSMMNCIIDKTL